MTWTTPAQKCAAVHNLRQRGYRPRPLRRKVSPQWVLEGDIVSCFDRIDHDWLLARVPMETSMLQKWLRAGFLDRSTFHPTESGTPQGGIISPALANVALDGLQSALHNSFRSGRSEGVHFVRNADDFIITGNSRELLTDEVRPLVDGFLGQRGLELSRKKTKVTHIATGFDFLGMNLRKYSGKLLIKPSPRRVHSFLQEVRRVIKSSGSLTAGELISRLNPLTRGWANYFRHVVRKATFARVDRAINSAIWRWAKQRHPNKCRGWRRRKYFRPHDSQQGVFSGYVDVHGRTRMVWLFQAMSVPIRRHIAVRGAANPFDPEWAGYFANRDRLEKVRPGHRESASRELRNLVLEPRGAAPSSRRAAQEA